MNDICWVFQAFWRGRHAAKQLREAVRSSWLQNYCKGGKITDRLDFCPHHEVHVLGACMQILRHIISARREAGLLSSPLYRDLCFFCRPENSADVELLVGACKLLTAHRDANGEEHPVMSWQIYMRPLLRNLSTVTSAMLCCWAHQITLDFLL